MKNHKKKILDYRYIMIQDGVCGSRPTIVGHRLEPRHLEGLSFSEIKACWKYLKDEEIQEALKFCEEVKTNKFLQKLVDN